VPTSAVRAQLMRILSSSGFTRAPRLRRFLAYVVDEALAGRFEQLKEYSLGVDVFDRGTQFDPRADPIVRVDARRLRKAIADYYAGEGVGDAVEISLPTGGYFPVFRLRTGSAGRPARPGARLAVARFEAQDGDEMTGGFAEGLTDELLLALNARDELRVVAAPGPARDGDDLTALARQLQADMVLSGKVRREGGVMRVRATLTSAADGAQVWGDRYDAALDDIGAVLALQDELARRIAGLVAPRLQAPWRGRTRPPTRDMEAYELYLRGRHQLNATRPDSLVEALSLLEAACVRDPTFAEALAGLAEAHFVSAIFLLAPPMEAWAASRRFAQAALAIDPDLPAAHVALARVSATLDHDFPVAQASFDRALLADPLSAQARQARAFWLLAPLGRLDEALAELANLLEQDPYSLGLRFDYARVLAFQHRFEDAIRHLELILEFQPDFPGAVFALAFAWERAGRIDLARAAHERHVRQLPYPLVTRWFDLACAAWDGAPDRARSIAEEMEAQATPVAATVMADAWLRVGESDRAVDWLERAATERLYRTIYLSVDPDYDPLRADARFSRLLRRVGLSEAARVPGT
jgi:TolB-like protein